MTQNNNRYQKWSDAAFQAWVNQDVDATEALWAEDATRQSMDSFDESAPLRGRAAIIEALTSWGDAQPKILKNRILCFNSEYGIGNARAEWVGQDTRLWRCDFIYKIALNSKGQCTSYLEWNVIRSKEST
ncbi:MAG: nuclear transport factor 2 family protein [Gammaproteobacteria bacterium]|nr:nuclear transport factor 2 family protein [Gammaproteobacteria bacterium]NIV15106.1 hypothetical protein [Fodinibius sp.]NIY20817.1 hypothetical protein [Gammaproteobacteria bacterium]